MPTQPKVSIIIPFYNVEDYIDKCLLSILPQLNDFCELILIDDGSTDRTIQRVENRLALYDKKVIFHKKRKNQGISHSRNLGLELATGEYLAWIDGDDWVEKDYIDQIFKAVKSNKDIYLITWQNANGKKEIYRSINLPRWNVSTWSRIWKRSIIHTKFDENLVWGEDGAFLMANMNNALSVGYIPYVIYYYNNNRQGSLTTVRPPKHKE
jgi:glycosyltransferase involved in cell wall biosynthesis